MHFLGLAGMPRRIPDYALQFIEFNQLASIGAFTFGLAQLVFVYNIIKSGCQKSGNVPDKYWDGAKGLTWDIPSPAPYHTFETPPVIR